jgi:hypothetical protein
MSLAEKVRAPWGLDSSWILCPDDPENRYGEEEKRAVPMAAFLINDLLEELLLPDFMVKMFKWSKYFRS